MTKHKQRRHSRKNNGLQDAAIILVLMFLIGTYAVSKDFLDTYPYIMPLLVTIVATLLALLVGIFLFKRWRAKRIYQAYRMTNIDTMGGFEFERYLADLLRRKGFTGIKLTEKDDLGIDIVAHKDGITWGIQAKRHRGIVKVAAVRQAYTALIRYKCDRAMVISNSFYSRPAKLLAQDTNTVLIGREQLQKWIYELSTAKVI